MSTIKFRVEMKTNDDVRKYIEDQGFEQVVIFEGPDYAPAFIGVTSDDRAVYDHDKMVEFLMDRDGMTEDEAVEFISYNTIRAPDYMEKGPVVMYPVEEGI